MKSFLLVRIFCLLISVFSLSISSNAYAMSEDEAYDVLSTRSSSFEDKSMAVKRLGSTESSLATLVLKAIDTGTLYFDKKEGGLYT